MKVEFQVGPNRVYGEAIFDPGSNTIQMQVSPQLMLTYDDFLLGKGWVQQCKIMDEFGRGLVIIYRQMTFAEWMRFSTVIWCDFGDAT